MKKGLITEKTDRDILKEARSLRGLTQTVLADQLGMKQNALSAYLLRSRMSVDGFTKILDALEYDVVVIDRRSGETMWKVEVEK